MPKIFSMQPVVLFRLSTDLRPNVFVRQIKKIDCKGRCQPSAWTQIYNHQQVMIFDGQYAKVKIDRLF